MHLRHQISTQWLGPNGECQQRLNAAAFWQEQCTLLQAENQGLRDRTVSLERQSELLATKLKNVETATVETASAQRSLPTSARSGVKRSRAKPTDDNPMRPAKRSKFASSPGLSRDENLQDTIEEDFGALNGGPCGTFKRKNYHIPQARVNIKQARSLLRAFGNFRSYIKARPLCPRL